MDTKIIPLLGLFRSGTNYTRTLLERNYNVVVSYNSFGWKHGLVPTFTKTFGCSSLEKKPLVVVKNPYSTMLSWYEYVKTNGNNIKSQANSFSDFLRSRIVFYNEFEDIRPQYRFSNPIDMWNCVVWNHISFADQMGGYITRYEDLLSYPYLETGRIAQWFNLDKKSGEFFIPRFKTKNMGENPRTGISDYLLPDEFVKEQYYLQQSYINEYTESDLNRVHKLLDTELLVKLSNGVERHYER